MDGLAEAWPLHGKAATRAAEAAALAAQPAPHALMALAGLAVARLALALHPHAWRVWVAAGPGNNGGDGLVAARHLHQCGWQVAVSLLGDPAQLPTDAAWALQATRDAGVSVQAGLGFAGPPAGPQDLVIDALLGVGVARAAQGALAACMRAINTSGAPVLAVDLPSGLDADTGQPWGPDTVRATTTLSLLTLKPGTYTAAGRDHAGSVWLHPLGVAAAAPTAVLHGPAPRSPRPHASHKGSNGDVAVVAGAQGMQGAAALAASAALAAGAGRVVVSLLADDPSFSAGLPPELMLRPQWWWSAPAVLARHTVVCGCGGGSAVAAALPPLLTHAARLVLDADALNAVAHDPALAQLLRQRAARGLPTVLTPHPLEAGRLLGLTAAQVQQDRLGAAQTLAAALDSVVLLKGSGTVITAPQALPFINPTGNAALAGPGTGDVLAGWLGGRWAQHPHAHAQHEAAAAAWEHGRAADVFAARQRGTVLRAGMLIEALAGGG